MPTNPAADMTVELLPAGAAGADARVTVVADQVLTAAPADVGKVVAVAADGTLELVPAAAGGLSEAEVQDLIDAAVPVATLLAGPQALTNEVTSGTTAEQWGTEELVIPGAGLGTAVTVLAFVTGFAERADNTTVTTSKGAYIEVEVSLDGGTTWDALANGTNVAWHGDENIDSRKAVTAMTLVAGTRTGDIQVRASVVTYNVAGKPVFKDGRLFAVVTHT